MGLVFLFLLIGFFFGLQGLVTAVKWYLLLWLFFWLLGAASYGWHRHGNHRLR